MPRLGLNPASSIAGTATLRHGSDSSSVFCHFSRWLSVSSFVRRDGRDGNGNLLGPHEDGLKE